MGLRKSRKIRISPAAKSVRKEVDEKARAPPNLTKIEGNAPMWDLIEVGWLVKGTRRARGNSFQLAGPSLLGRREKRRRETEQERKPSRNGNRGRKNFIKY